MAPTPLDQDGIDAALAGLDRGWSGTTERLSRSIEFADFTTAAAFVNLIAPRCDELDHHPDLELHWRRVDIELSTHSAGGVTDLDVTIAGILDEAAARLPQAS